MAKNMPEDNIVYLGPGKIMLFSLVPNKRFKIITKIEFSENFSKNNYNKVLVRLLDLRLVSIPSRSRIRLSALNKLSCFFLRVDNFFR
jgi:hypothetical protein